MSKPEQTKQRPETPHYENAFGGRGLVEPIGSIPALQKPTSDALRAEPHLFELSEKGAKATISDLTLKGGHVRVRVDVAGA